MPNKPILKGYKIYGIADHGYIFNWIWSLREKGLAEIVLLLKLTNTSYLIRTLILSLPHSYLIIYIDNFFTSVPLFTELQACNFGAIRTIRQYKEFP